MPEVVVSDVDESAVRAPRVAEQVALLAAAKASEVAKRESHALVIIGADSLLEFTGRFPGQAGRRRRGAGLVAADERTLRIPHTGQALFDVQDGAVVSRD